MAKLAAAIPQGRRSINQYGFRLLFDISAKLPLCPINLILSFFGVFDTKSYMKRVEGVLCPKIVNFPSSGPMVSSHNYGARMKSFQKGHKRAPFWFTKYLRPTW